jgi:ATP-dependent RNA helicase RhlE
MSFSSLGLSAPLVRAVEEKGYTMPSPIQLEAVPAVLSGRDVMAAAQTGTGKTAGFTLPLLQRLDTATRVRPNHVRALVLTPTRELAAQVHDSVVLYGQHLPLRSAVVFGGVKINPQMMKMRRGVDVLVATPGRLMDLYNQNAVKFADIEILVLDEADRMLDMGFIKDIRKIMSLMPKTRQNLLFSATFSGDIRTLANSILKNPIQIEISPQTTTAEGVKQSMFEVDKTKKTELLIHLVGTNNWNQVLVFMRTKHGCNRLVKKLEQFGISAAAIHGNKSQGARTKALADFKSNKIRVLVATDIAARGIDISDLPHVINFELPNVPEDYVHRIGRTGRAGADGEAISLVSADEVEFLADIENLIRKTLVRDVEVGFVPVHAVPLTKLGAPKANKPKKARRPSQSRGNGQQKEPNQKQAENRPRRAGTGHKPAAHVGQRRSRKPAAK